MPVEPRLLPAKYRYVKDLFKLNRFYKGEIADEKNNTGKLG